MPGGHGLGATQTEGATVMIMDMATGRLLDEFGQFAEEVLNASGLPQALVEQLGLQPVHAAQRVRDTPPGDPDDFLRQIYRSQE